MNFVSKICHSNYKRLCFFLVTLGPGLIVMLADTDFGSIIVAAQSGAVWGYRLLALQIILIPILYIAQELTLRLGLVTKLGHGQLIKKHFGNFWAWFSVLTLIVCCFGALISELSGIAGVGLLFNIPTWLSLLITIVFLIVLVWTRCYNSVERVAIAIGAFELIYFYVAFKAQPSGKEMWQGLTAIPIYSSNFLYLASANIGAVIMPWMIFYQQSAIIDKKLTTSHLNAARVDTAIGAILTQVIMCAIMIATAATVGKSNPGAPLTSVAQMCSAITPFIGVTTGKILFALGILGASLVATIVVVLSAAWSIGEITGCKHSLQDSPTEAPWFYGFFTLALILGGILLATNINLIALNIAIQVMNSLLLPIVIGFLYLLAIKTLPEPYKLKGWYAIFVGIVLGTTSIVGFVSGIWGIIKG